MHRRPVVDVSTACTYYRKFWDTVRTRVVSELNEQAPYRYLLSRRFFRFFKGHLREVISQHYGHSDWMRAGDFIADALYNAAWLFGKKSKKLGISPHQLWPDARPIYEAWQRLGRLPPPLGATRGVFEDTTSELRLTRPNQFEYPRIALTLACSNDKKRLPKLTIEIEGEPVCVLMKAMYELRDPEERRAIRKDAARIWHFLFTRLALLARIKESKGEAFGRPPERGCTSSLCPWFDLATSYQTTLLAETPT